MEGETDSTSRSRLLVPACGKVVFCSRALRHSGPDAGMETRVCGCESGTWNVGDHERSLYSYLGQQRCPTVRTL